MSRQEKDVIVKYSKRLVGGSRISRKNNKDMLWIQGGVLVCEAENQKEYSCCCEESHSLGHKLMPLDQITTTNVARTTRKHPSLVWWGLAWFFGFPLAMQNGLDYLIGALMGGRFAPGIPPAVGPGMGIFLWILYCCYTTTTMEATFSSGTDEIRVAWEYEGKEDKDFHKCASTQSWPCVLAMSCNLESLPAGKAYKAAMKVEQARMAFHDASRGTPQMFVQQQPQLQAPQMIMMQQQQQPQQQPQQQAQPQPEPELEHQPQPERQMRWQGTVEDPPQQAHDLQRVHLKENDEEAADTERKTEASKIEETRDADPVQAACEQAPASPEPPAHQVVTVNPVSNVYQELGQAQAPEAQDPDSDPWTLAGLQLTSV